MKWTSALSAIICSAALLTGCATSGGAPETPKQAVFRTGQALTVAIKVAQAYVQLPPCPQASQICSDQATINRMYSAASLATNAQLAAEAAVNDGQDAMTVAKEIGAAQQALDDLTAITSKVKTK